MSKAKGYIPYYDDIVEAMASPGCAFCKLQRRAAERYIDSLLWESVNDPRLRREVGAARGLCNEHAWLLVRPGGALSSAIIYQDVVRIVRRITEKHAAQPGGVSPWQRLWARLRSKRSKGDVIAAALAPERSCPVCDNAAIIDQHLCSTLLAALSRADDVLGHYRRSSGLCLHHFGALLQHAHEAPQCAAFAEAQLAVWSSLEAELAEFIRKNDHRFRGESFGAERDAWERAIALTSGPQPPSGSSRGGITQTG